VLTNKYYIDELGSRIIVRPTIKFANWVNIFDKKIIDGSVNLLGKVTVAISKAVHQFDLGVVDGIVNWTGKETFNSGKRLRILQTGNISGYALVMFAFLTVYIIYLIIRTIF
jgi:NADH-quinone oxidoreductase subunit L